MLQTMFDLLLDPFLKAIRGFWDRDLQTFRLLSPPIACAYAGVESSMNLTCTCHFIWKRCSLSGAESRIARFPESQARNRQKFRSQKQINESNRSKLEIAENRFGIAIRIASYHCLKQAWNRTIRNARF